MVVRQEAMTWANVGPDLCRHVASLARPHWVNQFNVNRTCSGSIQHRSVAYNWSRLYTEIVRYKRNTFADSSVFNSNISNARWSRVSWDHFTKMNNFLCQIWWIQYVIYHQVPYTCRFGNKSLFPHNNVSNVIPAELCDNALLTHWGLVTPYGDRYLGQHWLR